MSFFLRCSYGYNCFGLPLASLIWRCTTTEQFFKLKMYFNISLCTKPWIIPQSISNASAGGNHHLSSCSSQFPNLNVRHLMTVQSRDLKVERSNHFTVYGLRTFSGGGDRGQLILSHVVRSYLEPSLWSLLTSKSDMQSSYDYT